MTTEHWTEDGRGIDVALFMPSLRGGGAERVMVDLAHAFRKRGLNVAMILVRQDGPLLKDLPDDVRIVDLDRTRTAWSLLPLIRFLRRWRPRVVLSTLEHTNVIAALATRFTRDVRLCLREANSVSQDLPWSDGRSAILRVLMAMSYRWADHVVAVSQGVADDLRATLKLPHGRMRVIYNPVITPRLLSGSQEALEHPWFADGQPPVVLGVGRLDTQKRFDVLLRAFAALRRQTVARLVILGEGPLRQELHVLARDLGVSADLAMPGFVTNPFPYMRRASVFALSSDWEGLPNVLIQARALGTPVVATDCPSGPYEILEGGRLGALVAMGDDEAMAQALLEATRCGRSQPPEAWCQRFDATEVASQYLRVLGLITGAEDDRASGAVLDGVS